MTNRQLDQCLFRRVQRAQIVKRIKCVKEEFKQTQIPKNFHKLPSGFTRKKYVTIMERLENVSFHVRLDEKHQPSLFSV